jgi:outer membrane lipoprotein-sorting protein
MLTARVTLLAAVLSLGCALPAFASSEVITIAPRPTPAVVPVPQDDAPAPLPALSEQDRKDLRRIESYFNALKPLSARFVQAAHQLDGTVSEVSGTIKLWRPGRVRIDYAAPSKDFIVADGSNIYQWDDVVRQQSQAPIESTMAGFILKRDLRFEGDDVTVTKVAHPTPTRIEVSVRSAKDPQAGELTLVLQDVPLQLTGWRVLDAQGVNTSVTLSEVKTGQSFSRSDFVFRNPYFGSNTKGGQP